MNGIILLYTLFGDIDEARAVCHQLVEERLAGCANILSPCTSIYEWKAEVRQEAEIPVLLKTTAVKIDALKSRLKELHSYELPAILSWETAANGGYAEWIGQQTEQEQGGAKVK